MVLRRVRVSRGAAGVAVLIAVVAGVAWGAPDTTTAQPKAGPAVRFQVPRGHSGAVPALAIDASGRLALTGGADRTARLWDLEQRRLLRTLGGHKGAVRGVALRVDGRVALTASDDGLVRAWDTARGELLRTLQGHTGPVLAVVFAQDGLTAASAGRDGTVRVWDLSTGKAKHVLQPKTGAVFRLAFSADGARLVAAGTAAPSANPSTPPPGALTVWDVESGAVQGQFEASPGRNTGLALSPSGDLLIAAGDTAPIRLIDAKSGARATNWTGHTGPISALDFAPDGLKAASSSLDGEARLWDVKTGKTLHTFVHPGKQPVLTVAFRPGSDELVTTAADGAVRRWSLTTGQLNGTARAPSDWVSSVDLSQDGVWLVATRGEQAQLWHTPTGRMFRAWRPYPGSRLQAIAIAPDASRVAVATRNGGRASIWDTFSGERKANLEYDTFGGYDLTFSPDGERVMGTTRNGNVMLWSAKTGKETRIVYAKGIWSYDAAFYRERDRALSADRDKTVRLWDLKKARIPRDQRRKKRPSEEAVREYEGHRSAVLAIDVADRAKRAISGGHDHRVIAWDVKRDELLHTLKGHRGPICDVDITPDGKRGVSASWDGTVRVWDLDEGKLLRILKGHDGWSCAAAITPDGKRVYSGGSDRRLIVWDVERAAPIASMIGDVGGAYATWLPSGALDRSGWPYADLVDLSDGLQVASSGHAFGAQGAPHIVRRRLSEGKGTARALPALTARPKVRFDGLALREGEGPRAGTAKITITTRAGGLGELRLYQNGKRIAVTPGGLRSGMPGAASSFTFPVTFASGVNHFQARATNSDGVFTEPVSYGVAFDLPDTPKPRLRVLAVGAGDASSSAGAQAIADALAKRKTPTAAMYSGVDVTALTGKAATSEQIEAALSKLAKGARPEDVCVLYLSTQAQDPNATGPAALATRSAPLPLARLGDRLSAMPCLNQLFMLEVRPLPNTPKDPLAALPEAALYRLHDRLGLTVLAAIARPPNKDDATPSGEPASFTQTLLKALQGSKRAPRWKDGVLEIGELVRYTHDRLPGVSLEKEGVARSPVVWMSLVDGGLTVR